METFSSGGNLRLGLFIFLILLLTPVVFADDSQLYQSCGGDAELVIGCLDDSQNSFMGGVITSSSVGSGNGVPPTIIYRDVGGNSTNRSTIPEDDSGNWWLLIILVMIIVYLWSERKKGW